MEVLASFQIFNLVFFLEQRNFFFLLDVLLDGLLDFVNQIFPVLVFVFQAFLLLFVLHLEFMFALGCSLDQLVALGYNLVDHRLQLSTLCFVTFLHIFECLCEFFQIPSEFDLLLLLRHASCLLRNFLGLHRLLLVGLLVHFITARDLVVDFLVELL